MTKAIVIASYNRKKSPHLICITEELMNSGLLVSMSGAGIANYDHVPL
jgi:hypothetical protein